MLKGLGSPLLVAFGLMVCLTLPIHADDTSTFISAQQDLHATGFDHLLWWDNPTVGWTITCPTWAQGFPAQVDTDNVASGNYAISNFEPMEVCYDVFSFIHENYQPNVVVEYKYVNFNQKTSMIQVVR